jgi:hypothetical protein
VLRVHVVPKQPLRAGQLLRDVAGEFGMPDVDGAGWSGEGCRMVVAEPTVCDGAGFTVTLRFRWDDEVDPPEDWWWDPSWMTVLDWDVSERRAA